eukprot:12930467-Prorocentrum_lima.AAC.1
MLHAESKPTPNQNRLVFEEDRILLAPTTPAGPHEEGILFAQWSILRIREANFGGTKKKSMPKRFSRMFNVIASHLTDI